MGLKGIPELGTLEWDTCNPDCLIRVSNVDTFMILFNPLFFLIVQKIKNRFFKLERPSHFCKVILNGGQNFKFHGFHEMRLWLDEFYTLVYKYTRLVSRLRKREDQALVLISTILKFPVLIIELMSHVRFLYITIHNSSLFKFSDFLKNRVD